MNTGLFRSLIRSVHHDSSYLTHGLCSQWNTRHTGYSLQVTCLHPAQSRAAAPSSSPADLKSAAYVHLFLSSCVLYCRACFTMLSSFFLNVCPNHSQFFFFAGPASAMVIAFHEVFCSAIVCSQSFVSKRLLIHLTKLGDTNLALLQFHLSRSKVKVK